MSKARLVITAVIAEGLSQGEAARRYEISQGWISRLLARYRTEGEAAFNEVPIEAIADLCGHKSTIVTQKVYRHQLKPVITKGAVAINTIFAKTKSA